MIRRFFSDHKYNGFIVLAAFLCVAAYSVHYAQAHYNFKDLIGYGYSTYSPPTTDGCGGAQGRCHSPTPSSTTSVIISTTASQIEVGKTYTFQIVVKNPNKTLVAAGCDITVDPGPILDTFASKPSQELFDYDSSFFGTPLNELAHSMPKSFGGGDSAVWQFEFIAPDTPGTFVIYAAGNAVDGDSAHHATGQSIWNITTDTINVVIPSSVSAETSTPTDIQVFPNPSSGLFSISSQKESGMAEISISDEAGKTVETQNVNFGNNNLDLTPLPNGTYFLHIKTSDGQSFLRRVVIKK